MIDAPEKFLIGERVIVARSDGSGFIPGAQGLVYRDCGEFVEVVQMTYSYGLEETRIGGVLVPRERLHRDRRGLR